MGLFSGIIGLTYLQQRELNLEYDLENKMIEADQLTNFAHDLVSIGSGLDPESPDFKRLQQRKEKLNLMEKRIRDEITKIQTQLKLIEGQKQTMQKIVDASTKRLAGLDAQAG